MNSVYLPTGPPKPPQAAPPEVSSSSSGSVSQGPGAPMPAWHRRVCVEVLWLEGCLLLALLELRQCGREVERLSGSHRGAGGQDTGKQVRGERGRGRGGGLCLSGV